MSEALTNTDLQGALPLIARGKVRDLYDVDEKTLLMGKKKKGGEKKGEGVLWGGGGGGGGADNPAISERYHLLVKRGIFCEK